MIKSIRMKNFRSHEETELQLHEGVNVFLGESDSGKTNIIRALNWVIFNRPLGFKVHSDFAEPDSETEVCLELQEGDETCLVSLRKNSTGAVYTVKDEMSKADCKAIGKTVPDTVASALNINEINLQEQLDKPFLICESAPEVGRILNQATQLERVDKVTQSMTTKINDLNRSIKADTTEIELKKGELRKLERLDDLDELIDRAEKIATRIGNVDADIVYLQNAIELWEGAADQMKTFKRLDEFEELLSRASIIRDRILNEISSINVLVDYTNRMSIVEDELQQVRREIRVEKDRFIKFLHSIDECPYCKHCTTPIEDHDLDSLIGEG
jgi:DNA repair protein SbcC/Rad50